MFNINENKIFKTEFAYTKHGSSLFDEETADYS